MGWIFSKLNGILITTSSLIYWICLFAAMICVLLGMAGSEKFKNGTTVSVIIYTILQCIFSLVIK